MTTVSLVFVLLSLGCVQEDVEASWVTLDDWSGWSPGEAAPHRALVIGIDGIRPDAAALAATPWLDHLAERGAFTANGTTQLTTSTVSGPGWASISMGTEPVVHGIFENGEYDDRNPETPTFAKRLHDAGRSTMAVVHWPDIVSGISEDDAFDAAWLASDAGVEIQTLELFENEDPDLLFLHFDDVDAAGHATGFSVENPDYLAAIEITDAYVGGILEGLFSREAVADESWLIVVVTDHGGEGTSHGAMDAVNQTIPMWLAGPAVVPGDLGSASHMDTHPTVLAHAGIPVDPDWGLDGIVRGLE